MCPGCPVEDDVCLDVLVSWLPARSFNFFMWESTTFFPPRKLGHHLTLIKLFFLDFVPPTGKNTFQNYKCK